MWRYVMPRLVDKGYTVLAPDLRGLGYKARPASPCAPKQPSVWRSLFDGTQTTDPASHLAGRMLLVALRSFLLATMGAHGVCLTTPALDRCRGFVSGDQMGS